MGAESLAAGPQGAGENGRATETRWQVAPRVSELVSIVVVQVVEKHEPRALGGAAELYPLVQPVVAEVVVKLNLLVVV